MQERLNFLRFLLKDGQLWLCAPQAKQIWNCLAENAVFTQDREACFKWFSKLMGNLLFLLKFIYSEKATKFCEISTNYLSYVLYYIESCPMTKNVIGCQKHWTLGLNFFAKLYLHFNGDPISMHF